MLIHMLDGAGDTPERFFDPAPTLLADRGQRHAAISTIEELLSAADLPALKRLAQSGRTDPKLQACFLEIAVPDERVKMVYSTNLERLGGSDSSLRRMIHSHLRGRKRSPRACRAAAAYLRMASVW